jgi:hypothetical protein
VEKTAKEELHDSQSLSSIIILNKSRMGCVGHVARKGSERNVYRLLVEKTGGKGTTRKTKMWVSG